MRTFPAPNTSTFAADAHLAEGQFVLEEQTLNIAKSLIYRAGTRRPTISKTEGQNLTPRYTSEIIIIYRSVHQLLRKLQFTFFLPEEDSNLHTTISRASF
jgi:hypothetical protein